MAKRRVTLVPYVSGPVVRWKPDQFDWKKLARAFGKSLSPAQQQRIAEATETYVAFRSREMNSKPVRDTVNRIKQLRKSAESFRKAIEANDLSAEVFARHQIMLKFSEDYLFARDDLFSGLSSVVGSFVRACEHAIADLQLKPIEGEPIRPTDGTAWRIWVIELTGMAQESGLPTGARNDTDKDKGKPSPFVRLLMELQAQLPKELGHERSSESALAKAINIARQSGHK
jgi:hypothetical protein